MKKNFNLWHGAQAAWHHSRYGDRKVCVKQVAECLFPFLVLFGAHILSFYEWRVVWEWLGDNSDVTSVCWQISMKHLREKM